MRLCIYKMKEGKSLSKIEEYFSQYVHVVDFAKSPLDDRGIQVAYRYIDIDTLEYGSQIMGLHLLTPEEFEEHFELFWEVGEINNKMRELMQEDSKSDYK